MTFNYVIHDPDDQEELENGAQEAEDFERWMNDHWEQQLMEEE